MNFALILALAVAIVAVVFAFQNPQPMQVEFLGYRSMEASTALVLLITFTFGLVTGWLGALPGRIRAARAAKVAQKENARVMGTLNSATVPATDASVPVEADPYTSRFGTPPNP